MIRPIVAAALCVAAAVPAAAQQDARSAELIELNRAMLTRQIVERDAALFDDVALPQFVVVAPGGKVEDKAEAAAGVASFDASAIDVGDERVAFAGATAVVVGRLRIDGEMKPVGRLPPMRFMAVFVRGPEGWRLLARSLTPCAPIAIERGVC